jgi:hypothetical protein
MQNSISASLIFAFLSWYNLVQEKKVGSTKNLIQTPDIESTQEKYDPFGVQNYVLCKILLIIDQSMLSELSTT